MDQNQPFRGGINSAILRYRGARPNEPTSIPHSNPRNLKEWELHALFNPGAPGGESPDGVDFRLNLNPTFNFTTLHFSINNASFLNVTHVPVLLQILGGVVDAKDLLPKGSVYNLKPNQVVELTIPNNPEAVGGPVSSTVLEIFTPNSRI